MMLCSPTETPLAPPVQEYVSRRAEAVQRRDAGTGRGRQCLCSRSARASRPVLNRLWSTEVRSERSPRVAHPARGHNRFGHARREISGRVQRRDENGLDGSTEGRRRGFLLTAPAWPHDTLSAIDGVRSSSSPSLLGRHSARAANAPAPSHSSALRPDASAETRLAPLGPELPEEPNQNCADFRKPGCHAAPARGSRKVFDSRRPS
jgi:hypothetical protein